MSPKELRCKDAAQAWPEQRTLTTYMEMVIALHHDR